MHWLLGLSAGSVLLVIGLSGAVLAFREEITEALNPQWRSVPVAAAPMLTAPQLLAATRQAWPDRRVGSLTLWADPGTAARLVLAARNEGQRGTTVYLNPYSGAALPPVEGGEFLEWVEGVHRWLLLPREPGRMATGALAMALLLLALSGLYLRWPRRPLDWRAWFTFNTALRGRAFLWRLHSVMGSCALMMYLVSASTGIYWAFDGVRSRVDSIAADPPRRVQGTVPAEVPGSMRTAGVGEPGIEAVWRTFDERARAAGGWTQAILIGQPGSAATVTLQWLAPDAPHDRARNRMVVRWADGEILHDERHADKSATGRALAAVYPMHMGSYLGLPGRIAMFLAALMLGGFSISGWMLHASRSRGRLARA